MTVTSQLPLHCHYSYLLLHCVQVPRDQKARFPPSTWNWTISCRYVHITGFFLKVLNCRLLSICSHCCILCLKCNQMSHLLVHQRLINKNSSWILSLHRLLVVFLSLLFLSPAFGSLSKLPGVHDCVWAAHTNGSGVSESPIRDRTPAEQEVRFPAPNGAFYVFLRC